MHKSLVLVLALASTLKCQDVSQPYAAQEKLTSFNPDLRTEPVLTHPLFKKETKEDVTHPVYRPDEHRARIEYVKPDGGVVKHDMLADQPNQAAQSDVSRIDNLGMPNYGYAPGAEVAYPDVPYAPGYGYENSYGNQHSYDPYETGMASYFLEPDTSALSFLWSQVPDARAVVGFVGRTLAWIINSMFLLFVGSFLTVAVCSYTNVCTIAFHNIGPIHEEMRAMMTPERLEKISTAADFVKNAIDKYQMIQRNKDVKGI